MWRYRQYNGIGFNMPPEIYKISLQEIKLKNYYLRELKKYELDPPQTQNEVIKKADHEKKIKEIEYAFGYVAEEFRKPLEALLVGKEGEKQLSINDVVNKYRNDNLLDNDPKQITEENLRIAIQKVAYGMAVIGGRI